MAKNFEVLISNMLYDQQDITIAAGDTVTWINEDAMKHSVTADPGSQLSITEIIVQGTKYSPRQTFPTAGKLSYHCKFHAGMNGSVTVT